MKTRRLKLLLIAITILFCSQCFSQDSIIVHKDPRLDLLTAKQAAINKITAHMTSTGQYRGYRLQLLNTRSREEAFKLKSQMLQSFPAQKTYIVYQSPYFKVRIGNFIKPEAAADFKKQLVRIYKGSAYLVEDVIEYTPSDEDDDE